MKENILFLTGSPKPQGESVCASVEARFIKLLDKSLFNIEKINIRQVVNTEDGRHLLLEAVNNNSSIILISPLYLDTAPASVIRLMEFLKENKNIINGPKKMVVVSICGFPEAFHNDAALRIYRRFADEMEFMWVGSLALGESFAYLYAQQIFSMIGMYRRLDRVISLTTRSLVDGKTISQETEDLVRISIMPYWLYTKIAILIAKMLSIKDGVWNLYKRPYA